MKINYLTYQEFIELAKKNYCKGGMTFFECWDENTFKEECEMYGQITVKKAFKMFNRMERLERGYIHGET